MADAGIPELDLGGKKKKKVSSGDKADKPAKPKKTASETPTPTPDDAPALELGEKKKKKKVVKKSADGEGGGDSAPAAEGNEEPELVLEKKKKKKKVVKSEGGESAESTPSAAAAATEKPKKKKKPVPEAVTNDAGDDDVDAAGDDAGGDGDGGDDDDDDDGEDDGTGLSLTEQVEGEEETMGGLYSYSFLLGRVVDIMSSRNLGGVRKRTLKPPQVVKDGARKTAFTNFIEMCKSMNREPDHVQAFLLGELGTTGNLDGNDALIMRGRFQPKGITAILRRYINEYVVCHMCRSLETVLTKDPATRLIRLQCENCGASRSVQSIHKGYTAVIRRRK